MQLKIAIMSASKKQKLVAFPPFDCLKIRKKELDISISRHFLSQDQLFEIGNIQLDSGNRKIETFKGTFSLQRLPN